MGTNVVLTAVPGGDSEFIGWSGGCSGTGDCQVAGGATASVAAEFGIREYALSVSLTSDGTGTVTSNPAGIDCGSDCEHDYPHGTMVTLTASADAQSAFAGWSGACTGDAGCTVTMDAAKTVSAAFDALPQCHPASRTTDCASGESCYVIIATGLGTCQAPAGGLLTTGTECNSAAPGTQGCDCQFLNGCDIGYGCLLNNDPMNATGLVCAYFCDPLPGGTGPQCGDSIVGGSDVDGPGANYSCRQIQTFYSNGMNVPADIGMCINPVTYPTCAGCTDESQPGCDPDMFPCCDDGTVTPTDPSDDCP